MDFKRYFIKKSVQRIQDEAQAHALKRTLGPWNLLSLGIGCIIGAGIFVMTGTAAAGHAGPAIVLSFVLAGFACAFAGLCYAELASVLPVSGSAYTYAYATLGESIAWAMGWLLVLEYGISASAVAVGWAGYLTSFMRDFGLLLPPELTAATGAEIMVPPKVQEIYTNLGYAFNEQNLMLNANGDLVTGTFNVVAFLGILAVTTLLTIGVNESAKVNNIIVFIKTGVIVAFIAIGVFYIDGDNWTPFIPENTGEPGEFGISGILRAASIIFFAYIGFEAISTAAAEAKNPQKDMPIGILGSLIVCTILYMMTAAVLTGVVHYSTLDVPDPMAVAVDSIGLGWFSFVIKVGAIMGLSSVMLVLVYGQTRVFYTMSRDGLLPQAFCKVHPRFHTPHINTIMVGIIVAFAAAMTPIGVLGDLVSLGTLLAFMVVCIAVLYLRKAQPDLHRPFKVPFSPVVPILGILACGYLVAQMPIEIFIKLKWFFLAGIIIYLVYGQHKSRLARELKPRPGDPEFIQEEHEKRVD